MSTPPALQGYPQARAHAHDSPFYKPLLSKQPTTGGENAMTIW